MWYLILGLITFIYLLLNLILPSMIGGFAGSYVIRPLLWVLLAITVLLISKKEGLNIWKFKIIRKWEIGRNPFEAALLIAGFQISLLVILGLFFGFGKSPYSFTPLSILTNIFFIFSMVFGIELSRSYLIKKGISNRRNVTVILGLATLLFMLIYIQPTDFFVLNFNDPVAAVKFLGETIIPLLAMSLFASYLAYLGGAMAAIGYMGALTAFEWFSPVLPSIDWTLVALVGTLVPAIGFLIIQQSIQTTQRSSGSIRKRRKKKDPTLSWTGLAVICVVIVFFSTGFFGVQPTIIYSGSMRSSIDVGDIVLIQDVPIEEINEGDVIQFSRDDMQLPIVHRVYDIYEEENTIYYLTKGDANDDPDSDPIVTDQVMGKAVFTIPKIGWIPIVIKEFIYKITTAI